LIVSVAVLLTPEYVAVMTADVFDLTEVVVTVNVAVFEPAPTVTLEGTLAELFELERATTTPPVGALPVSVTVPVDVAPALTELGERVSEESAGGGTGLTARGAVFVTPP
jgi:hypothetical protein